MTSSTFYDLSNNKYFFYFGRSDKFTIYKKVNGNARFHPDTVFFYVKLILRFVYLVNKLICFTLTIHLHEHFWSNQEAE